MKQLIQLVPTVLGLLLAGQAAAADPASVARGRYLTTVAGCNDCHTADYAQAAGAVPEAQRLTGTPLGFNGPWGTSYAGNLRLLAQQVATPEQWLAVARAPRRPPMPWFALRDMTDADVIAIYDYLRSLGPAGGPAPAAVPPGQAPATPFIVFVPQAPARAAAAGSAR